MDQAFSVRLNKQTNKKRLKTKEFEGKKIEKLSEKKKTEMIV